MYFEARAPHHSPHFHAYFGDQVAVFGIQPVELISGELPRRQARRVEAWAEMREAELVADWDRLQSGQRPLPIAPLS
jgi:hypothetical protein